MKKQLLALALAPLAFSAAAQDSASNTLEECFIQEVIPGRDMTGGFFLLTHHGKTQKIVKAEIPSITPTVELHEMIMKDDVMQMQEITEYPLAEGENRFKKGGYHLMLMNVAQAPEIHSMHTLTLTLDDGETLNCEAKVLTVDEVMALPGVEKSGDGDGHGHGQAESKH